MSAITITAFGLRGMSAGAKFLLVMYIASTGSADLLGEVAIITATTALFSQIAGLEINQVIGRRLHSLDTSELIRTLRTQAIVCLCAYIALIPVALVSYAELFSSHFLSVGLILIFEHFITEVYRLNILLLRPLYASCLLFIKNVGWVAIFIGLTSNDLASINFDVMLYCWLSVLLTISAPLIIWAWFAQKPKNIAETNDRFYKIPPLLRESLPFIISAILTGGAGTIDKLIIGKSFPIEELGIFFFFSTYASMLSLVVTFSVGSTTGPECIKTYATQGKEAFTISLSQLKKKYLSTIATTATLIILLTIPLLLTLNKQQYIQKFDILIYLIISASFISLCDPIKLEEYLSRNDGNLVIGNGFHLFSTIFAIIISSQSNNISIVAFSIMLSSIATFAFFLFNGPKNTRTILKLIVNKH